LASATSRVVDQDIHGPEFLADTIKQPAASLGIREVDLDVEEPTTGRLDLLTCLGGLAATGYAGDVGPGLGQSHGDATAQPTTCSGHQGGSTVELKEIEDHDNSGKRGGLESRKLYDARMWDATGRGVSLSGCQEIA